jgi:hypothetical protein
VAISPRLESIFASLLPYWEVMELQTRPAHDAKTTAQWLRRLESHDIQFLDSEIAALAGMDDLARLIRKSRKGNQWG